MDMDYNPEITDSEDYPEASKAAILNFEDLIMNNDLSEVAERLLESTYENVDPMRRDLFDRFLDFVYFKTQTGVFDVINMAYPAKRMRNRDLEKRVVELINNFLYPEIVLRLLKTFMRNVHDPDSNLCIANLIYSEQIVQAVFNTFKQFKSDVFETDIQKRSLNVKRIQQFSSRSDDKLSNPLDAAARLKYILEFLAIKLNVSRIYTIEDLRMSPTRD